MKTKLLVFNNNNTGVGKFRLIDGHVKLQNLHPKDFHVDFADPKELQTVGIKNYDLVFFHSSLAQNENFTTQLAELKNQHKFKTIVDIDDYWELNFTHGMARKVQKDNTALKIINCVKSADLVTTTTEFFASKLRNYNKKVIVLKNAIDIDESQFQSQTIKSDYIRFGWVGGSSHLDDIELLHGLRNRLKQEKTPNQLVLCGFNDMIRNIETGELFKNPIGSVWARYEAILTEKYNLENINYTNWLLSFRNERHDFKNVPYERRWTLPISQYGTHYNHIDVSLAPLRDRTFNHYKSELKIIESGFHKKPVIASNLTPYASTIKHGVNGFLVDERKTHKEFFKYSKWFLDNPNAIEDFGQNLYESVTWTNELKKITEFRYEAYKSLALEENLTPILFGHIRRDYFK